MLNKKNRFTISLQLVNIIVFSLSILAFIGLIELRKVFVFHEYCVNKNGLFGIYSAKMLLFLVGIMAYPLTMGFIFITAKNFYLYKNNKKCIVPSKHTLILLGIITACISLLMNIFTNCFPEIGYLFKNLCISREIKINNVFSHYEIVHCAGGVLTHIFLFNNFFPILKIIGIPGFSCMLITLFLVCSKLLWSHISDSNHAIAAQEYKNFKENLPNIIKRIKQDDHFSKSKILPNVNHKSFITPSLTTQTHKIQTSLYNAKNVSHNDNSDHIQNSKNIIIDTLSSFSIDATIGSVHIGPAFSLFELRVPPGIKVQKIKQLAENISLRLKMDAVRIVCPVKGTDSLGIEVKNQDIQAVSFIECIRSFVLNSKDVIKEKIPVILGENVYGETITCDIASLPHLLIAGTTGSGKSVCINTILTSIITLNSPEQTKFILIDPKLVELSQYNSCPHMISDIITCTKEAYYSLRWLIDEMERRYEQLKEYECRNIDSYNEKIEDNENKMYRILCVIDEFNDLLCRSEDNIEDMIVTLAQKSRSAGIHIILATQRPSREVVTGLIKANFPARIAFKVANRFDSQIIIDEVGAETLSGNGDMFLVGGTLGNALSRVQGCFLSESEVDEYISHTKQTHGIRKKICSKFSSLYKHEENIDSLDMQDPMIEKAIEIAKESKYLSATLLQRHLKIGYPRAAGIIDHLTRCGIISAPNNQRLREYLG